MAYIILIILSVLAAITTLSEIIIFFTLKSGKKVCAVPETPRQDIAPQIKLFDHADETMEIGSIAGKKGADNGDFSAIKVIVFTDSKDIII